MRATRRGFEDDFLAAIDGIYAASSNDGSWNDALVTICNFIGSHAADLNVVDPVSMQYRAFHPARVDPFVLQYIADHMKDLPGSNPRMTKIYNPSAEKVIVADSDIWTTAERNSIPFFADFLQPWGTFDSLNTWVRKGQDGRPWVAIAVHFQKSDCPPQAEHRRRLKILLPHIHRACSSEERLNAALGYSSTLAETLDHVAEPVTLVNRDGKVIRANKAASEIFKRSSGISLSHDNRVIFSRADARDAFSRSLAQCISSVLILSDINASPPSQIVVHRTDASPLVLTLQPLSTMRQEISGAVAALFISDPDSKSTDNLSSLRAAYGLSPAEIKLVQALSEGQSLKEFSIARGISYETARFHMRRILSKTGVHRQSDLMRLIRTMR